MTATTGSSRRLRRLEVLDARPVALDGFNVPDPTRGLVALSSPADPAPSLVVVDGRIVELDGKPAADFDVIDTYIATHGIDLDVAGEVMADEGGAAEAGSWPTKAPKPRRSTT